MGIPKKITLFLIVLVLLFSATSIYFLFFSKCPYEIGSNIIEWIRQPCPYIIKGSLVNQISEVAISDAIISFPKGDARPSEKGDFIIKTRGDLNKITIKKDGYYTKEVNFSVSKENPEVNLGKLSFLPEGRVLYQKGGTIFSTNFDSSEVKKITDGILIAIAPRYDKFLFKNFDSKLQIMDIEGNVQMKFSYEPKRLSGGPTFTTFSLDGNILAWIGGYEVETPEGKRADEEIFFYNLVMEELKSVSQIFRNIYNFRISPDEKYIAVAGISYDGSHIVHLEDILRRKILLQIKNPETYFFDQENFYYSVPGSGWYIYHLQDGKTEFLDLKPIWWENKFSGIINPYTKKDIAILKPGWSIRISDINGQNVKKLVELEPPSGYPRNLTWSSNENYLLFEISQPYSLNIIDINSGKYKEIQF